MKRLHVHIAVDDLEASTRFYSQLFAADPVVSKQDYAKWMLEDPRVNVAISARATRPGIEHLGIQVEDRDELAEIYQRLKRAGIGLLQAGFTRRSLLLRARQAGEREQRHLLQLSMPREKAQGTLPVHG